MMPFRNGVVQKKKGIAGWFGGKETVQVPASSDKLRSLNEQLIALQADMRAYALHGDLFPGQLFRVGEQVVHLERRCGLCRFRRLFPVVRIAAASCGHERRRGDYQIYD